MVSRLVTTGGTINCIEKRTSILATKARSALSGVSRRSRDLETFTALRTAVYISKLNSDDADDDSGRIHGPEYLDGFGEVTRSDPAVCNHRSTLSWRDPGSNTARRRPSSCLMALLPSCSRRNSVKFAGIEVHVPRGALRVVTHSHRVAGNN